MSLKYFILLYMLLHVYICQEAEKPNELLEMTDEQYMELRERYRIEEKAEEKIYQEAALHPERYDRNKDKKISKGELRKAIASLIFPKSKEITRGLHPKIMSFVNGRIESFCSGKPDFLTYRQLSYVIMRLGNKSFISAEYFDEINSLSKVGIEESSLDL